MTEQQILFALFVAVILFILWKSLALIVSHKSSFSEEPNQHQTDDPLIENSKDPYYEEFTDQPDECQKSERTIFPEMGRDFAEQGKFLSESQEEKLEEGMPWRRKKNIESRIVYDERCQPKPAQLNQEFPVLQLPPRVFPNAIDLIIAGFILLPFAFNLLQRKSAPSQINQKALITNILLYSLLAFVILARFSSKIPELSPGWFRPQLRKNTARIVLYLLGICGFTILYRIGIECFFENPNSIQNQPLVEILRTSKDPVLLWLIAISSCVVAPIWEEIAFRGFLHRIFSKLTGRATGTICSGFLFGLVHGQLFTLIPLSLFGILLAMLYDKSKSLWPPILLHFGFNAITVISILYSKAPV